MNKKMENHKTTKTNKKTTLGERLKNMAVGATIGLAALTFSLDANAQVADTTQTNQPTTEPTKPKMREERPTFLTYGGAQIKLANNYASRGLIYHEDPVVQAGGFVGVTHKCGVNLIFVGQQTNRVIEQGGPSNLATAFVGRISKKAFDIGSADVNLRMSQAFIRYNSERDNLWAGEANMGIDANYLNWQISADVSQAVKGFKGTIYGLGIERVGKRANIGVEAYKAQEYFGDTGSAIFAHLEKKLAKLENSYVNLKLEGGRGIDGSPYSSASIIFGRN